MKKVLIVIQDMGIGGAQKSLLSFLNCMMSSSYKDQYDISLMVIKPEGAFLEQIPEGIKRIQSPRELQWMGRPFSFDMITSLFSIAGLLGEMVWVLRRKLKLFPGSLNVQQQLWSCWSPLIPKESDPYDIAVSYIDGTSNYYVMEKIKAPKKVLWIHNEYQKQGYSPFFDRPYYDSCAGIVTISAKCQECILNEFPQYKEKVYILENITSWQEVSRKAREGTCAEFDDGKGLKLLSVGRLNSQKGFDQAIEAAKLLKDAGVEFLWLILGEGEERPKLQALIDDFGLEKSVRMIGSRENPYAYMASCDILVQTSRFEGKSIVLDEAKALCRPIVVTNYTTVRDSITHGKTGWIVEMDPQAICDGIIHLWNNKALRESLEKNLQGMSKGNLDELQQYINTML